MSEKESIENILAAEAERFEAERGILRFASQAHPVATVTINVVEAKDIPTMIRRLFRLRDSQ